jgi:hypothetical protein
VVVAPLLPTKPLELTPLCDPKIVAIWTVGINPTALPV